MAKIIDSAAYDELVASGKPFVIDFWAEWGGPCRSLTPIIEELAEEYEGKVVIGKCDVEENDDITMKYGVRNIPTIIFKVLIPEAKTSLIVGATISCGTILGYSAMSGAIGGGGLGQIAISYGYNRYQTDVLFVTVALLIVLMQVIQIVGMKISRKTDKRVRN